MSLKNSDEEASKASGADFVASYRRQTILGCVLMQLQQKISCQQRLESVKRKLIK